MKQQIEGLFLNAQSYTESSVIIHLFTKQYGRQSFFFKGVKKKNHPYIFQPFHFIEFTSNFDPDKTLNSGSSPALIIPFHEITNDIRKVSIALFLTEVMYYLLKEGAYSPLLYPYLERSITLFDKQPFYPDFHLIFLVNLLSFLGIQPKNNYSSFNQYFSISEAQFVKDSNSLLCEAKLSDTFFNLLGTEIDALSNLQTDKKLRNDLIELLFKYLEIHFQFNAKNITSHKILKTIFN